MSAEQAVATPIFDGVVAEAGLDWSEEDVPQGGADEGKKPGSTK
ncbi:hypothetical protein [Amycolatopsis echigonensis]|uniref:Uncharacterized protein n=1 Tax=Amycolatopsis echigonensis TaxID=2576905 RepID=A0A2N3WC97_9PSEU|nr:MULTISPECIES: hypothetical protein [Amycolatopsis]PKV91463.1 hypothetical protein ATK30_2237 [Amycolatopsis niigatensis]